MGYSEHKKAIRRVEAYLKQMVESSVQLEFQSENSKKLSYHIFEAIKTSKRYAAESPLYLSYSELGAKFKIRILNDRVICEPREISLLTKSQSLSSVVIPDVGDALGIIGAAIQNKSPIMTFPQAGALDQEGLTRINNFATKNGYYMIISDQGLILSKDESARSLAWIP